MSYTISCVLLIPAEHRAEINALAESLGYGPNNLSVSLADSSGNKWYGCHTWCEQVFIDQLNDPIYASDAISALVISAIDGGVPSDNWHTCLASHGLSLAEDFP